MLCSVESQVAGIATLLQWITGNVEMNTRLLSVFAACAADVILAHNCENALTHTPDCMHLMLVAATMRMRTGSIYAMFLLVLLVDQITRRANSDAGWQSCSQ
jgi:hypothetical protein